MMELFYIWTVPYNNHQPHELFSTRNMASESEDLSFSSYLILIQYNVNLSGNTRLVASVLDSAALKDESWFCHLLPA